MRTDDRAGSVGPSVRRISVAAPPAGARAQVRTPRGRRQPMPRAFACPPPSSTSSSNLVGELVTVQARLGEIAARRDDPDVTAVSEEIERLTSALRENSMSIRMLPIRGTFETLPPAGARPGARSAAKRSSSPSKAPTPNWTRRVIDQLNDPLMHLIRNSMDHGIEPPEARLAARQTPDARRSIFRRGTRAPAS